MHACYKAHYTKLECESMKEHTLELGGYSITVQAWLPTEAGRPLQGSLKVEGLWESPAQRLRTVLPGEP